MAVHRFTKSVRVSKGPVLAVLVCLLFASLTAGPARSAHGLSSREIMEGDKIGPRTLETFDGLSLDVPSGQELTVVLFWAMWSPRSEDALQFWQKLDRDFSEHPLEVITVNVEHQDLQPSERDQIIQYFKDRNLELPLVMDPNLDLFDEFGVKAVPSAFFLDREGLILRRYPSFPSSAPLDLEEEVEINLNLRKKETEEEKKRRGKLAYQPRNNALLYYNMGVQLQKKRMHEKALARFITALQLDPEYSDPLRTLEGIYFLDGRTHEKEEELKSLLIRNDLDSLVDRIGEGPPIVIDTGKKLNARERMKQLMEQGQPGTPAQQ